MKNRDGDVAAVGEEGDGADVGGVERGGVGRRGVGDGVMGVGAAGVGGERGVVAVALVDQRVQIGRDGGEAEQHDASREEGGEGGLDSAERTHDDDGNRV